MRPADAKALRRAGRKSMLLKGTLHVGRVVREVRVRNLSAGGALVDWDTDIAPGAPVTIELRNIGVVFGQAAWIGNGRLGIVFDEAIDPDAARLTVNVAAPPEPTVYRRPGTGTRYDVTKEDFEIALGLRDRP